MKTSIKTLIATSLTAIALTSSIFSLSTLAAEQKPTTISTVIPFKKILVKGNVEVTLVQRLNEGINYSDDNTGGAKVVQEGNVLHITSMDKAVCKLILYVNDIYRIEASENAVVKTSGKLKAKFLQVFISENARADIGSTTEGLYTVISDNAELNLSGATDNHTLIMGKTPKLTIDRFAALKTNISSIEAREGETVALIK